MHIGIEFVDAERRVTHHDRIHVQVPRDFHVHNDSVAAALMTLVGRSCPIVTFNFPISTRCAGTSNSGSSSWAGWTW